MDNEEGFGGWIIFGLIFLVVWFFFFKDKAPEPEPYSYDSYQYDSYGSSDEEDCSYLEPENPYGYGSGHYAGYEWAEMNEPGYCDGNSNSFIEGCEDYLAQSEEYEACLYE